MSRIRQIWSAVFANVGIRAHDSEYRVSLVLKLERDDRRVCVEWTPEYARWVAKMLSEYADRADYRMRP